ncbi:hypothetical protein GCM10022386_07300 [Flavobacterium cheonhonense]|uniref:DUF4357 domain-containing protein n=1 Tax=Flavobacterium cheonhonense TaxID=706185 RepID=A0ABP7THH6_9FLAO|nr:DUF4357 domain-containing protein [Flavobacterium cheonhonense]
MLRLYIKTLKLAAEGNYFEGKIEILEGSELKKEISASFPKSMIEKREYLIQNGIIKDNGQNYIFTENYISKSPSEASNMILGTSSNGMLYWKNKDGKSLGKLILNDDE